MRAVVLDGSLQGDQTSRTAREVLEEELKENGWKVRSLQLRDMDIGPCDECYRCWTRHPGLCASHDQGRMIPGLYVTSDLAVFLSPVTFGAYSSQLKKALDRMIPNVLPFFEKYDGEVRHRKRYPAYPKLVAIGILDRPVQSGETIFRKLVERNAITFSAPAHAAGFVYGSEDQESIRLGMRTVLSRVGVKV
ncbi:MAG: flavodoxin family protein [Methanomicrobiales archaeon]|nr:flavodoxin family protein [Methanomicrobiales archaeon]NYT21794.1 flavodoxin family protein [Methanomicrobiales archaeon]